MQKRRLGDTAIEVSALGLGTVKFGRNTGVKYPCSFTIPGDEEVKNLLAIAKDLGINLLDTAPAYGNSEERLGHLLKRERKDWVLMTKAGEEFVNDSSQYNFTASGIHKSVEQSLKRLQTDYLDIVLIHSNGEDEKVICQERALDSLVQLKASGKIRAFGFSGKTITGGLLAINQSDCAMVTFNPQYRDEVSVIRHARANNKGIFIKKAFASGHLSLNQDGVKAAFDCVFAEPGVTSVVIGTINPSHLKQNVEVALRSLHELSI